MTQGSEKRLRLTRMDTLVATLVLDGSISERQSSAMNSGYHRPRYKIPRVPPAFDLQDP